MYDKSQYQNAWAICEYFLDHYDSGVNLISFDLIKKNSQGQFSQDAYIYERLTRPVLAKTSRGVKRFAKEYVDTDQLGQIESRARSFQDKLVLHLYEDIKTRLDIRLAWELADTAIREETPELLLVLASVYYVFHKNKKTSHLGSSYYLKIFFSLLGIFRKGSDDKIATWNKAMQQIFRSHWKVGKPRPFILVDFFEHRTVKKIMALSLSSILGVILEDKDRTRYLFEVVNDFPKDELDRFQKQIANGLYTVLNKKKRFPVSPDSGSGFGARQASVIEENSILGIINRVVDLYFDSFLDLIIQFYLSEKDGNPKHYLLKQSDKTFLKMNRSLWKEIQDLIQIQRRVAFRTRHLLRIIIYYLFEVRKIERKFWKKYIPSVEKIIHYAFKENKEQLQGVSRALARQITEYRNTQEYKGTDWDGFYKDAKSRSLAREILKETVEKSRSRRDRKLPAIWFSNQVEKGIDYLVLFRFFRNGVKEI